MHYMLQYDTVASTVVTGGKYVSSPCSTRCSIQYTGHRCYASCESESPKIQQTNFANLTCHKTGHLPTPPTHDA